MSPTNFFGGHDQVEPWTLAQIYADLCSRRDIPRLLNVNEYRVIDWINRRDVINSPRPVTRLGHIDIYSRQEWRDWYAKWQDKHADRLNFKKTKSHGAGEEFWSYFEEDDDARDS